MTPDKLADVLARADRGDRVEDIATAADVTIGYVYGVLREHRPDRKRTPRARTSEKRSQIRIYHAAGIKPVRIAELLKVKRQYVYRIIGET